METLHYLALLILLGITLGLAVGQLLTRWLGLTHRPSLTLPVLIIITNLLTLTYIIQGA